MRRRVRKMVIVTVVAALLLLALADVIGLGPTILPFACIYVLTELEKIPSLSPLHWKKTPASVTYDTFKDGRNMKKYRTIKMPDGRIWIAENLDYQTGNSWYYKDSFFGISIRYKNCGRLYDWETAMSACPNGWHVPSFEEWDSWARAVGGIKEPAPPHMYTNVDYWRGAGEKLTSAIFRKYTDNYGFSALRCGNLPIDGYEERRSDMFGNGGTYGYNSYWWTATEGASSDAYVIKIDAWNNYTAPLGDKRDGNSVRCVADRP